MQCQSPIRLQLYKDGKHTDVPCGKCYDCKIKRVSGWALRLGIQARHSESAHFVTLTYSEETVPISGNDLLTLWKPDFQNFMKRLRKISRKTLKYYAVGEYGSKTQRPHYHAIIFNSNYDDVLIGWTLNKNLIGEIHIGNATEGAAAYCAKYIMKNSIIPVNDYDDRVPEFSLMSKGLGLQYLTPSMLAFHERNLVENYFAPVKGNFKVALPRYYKERIYSQHQRHWIREKLENKRLIELNNMSIEDWEREYDKNDVLRIVKEKLKNNDTRTSKI